MEYDGITTARRHLVTLWNAEMPTANPAQWCQNAQKPLRSRCLSLPPASTWPSSSYNLGHGHGFAGYGSYGCWSVGYKGHPHWTTNRQIIIGKPNRSIYINLHDFSLKGIVAARSSVWYTGIPVWSHTCSLHLLFFDNSIQEFKHIHRSRNQSSISTTSISHMTKWDLTAWFFCPAFTIHIPKSKEVPWTCEQKQSHIYIYISILYLEQSHVIIIWVWVADKVMC